MQEIQFSSRTSCGEHRKVLHYSTLYVVSKWYYDDSNLYENSKYKAFVLEYIGLVCDHHPITFEFVTTTTLPLTPIIQIHAVL